MDMTPEQLDEARAREAQRQIDPDCAWEIQGQPFKTKMALAARLAREGWTPTDPDLIEAREVCAPILARMRGVHEDAVFRGVFDLDPDLQCALAAIKRGRELAAKP